MLEGAWLSLPRPRPCLSSTRMGMHTQYRPNLSRSSRESASSTSGSGSAERKAPGASNGANIPLRRPQCFLNKVMVSRPSRNLRKCIRNVNGALDVAACFFFLAKLLLNAFNRSRAPSSRMSNGMTPAQLSTPSLTNASFFTHNARSLAMVMPLMPTSLTCAVHWLYVHRTAPIHWRSSAFCDCVGYTRTFRVFMAAAARLLAPSSRLRFVGVLLTPSASFALLSLSFVALAALAAVGGRALAIASRHKDVDNREQIVGEFAVFGDGAFGTMLAVENHECAVRFCKDELQELVPKATQSVFVGNHNAFDMALVDAFQKGEQSSSSKVDAAADVAEDCRGWTCFLEDLDLSLEVLFLMGGTDTGVRDGGACCRLHGVLVKSNVFANVTEVVVPGATLATAVRGTHNAFGSPQLKRIIVNINDIAYSPGSHVRCCT